APARGLVHRLEDQRVVPVAPRRSDRRRGGRAQPASVLFPGEDGGEARARVEAREATPVDRAGAADQRDGLQVADQPVVLDQRHPVVLHERRVSESRSKMMPRVAPTTTYRCGFSLSEICQAEAWQGCQGSMTLILS